MQLLKDLRQHNKLLQAYFNKLFELADSKAPEAAKQEVEGIATNLNKIGNELKVNPLIPNSGIF
uniref:hypothetical protein n=1 Tax=Hassallia byssoidea TaxID=482630 RepID=UPI001F41CF51|nr:hypothetical protein [Hassalia byssoidea]